MRRAVYPRGSRLQPERPHDTLLHRVRPAAHPGAPYKITRAAPPDRGCRYIPRMTTLLRSRAAALLALPVLACAASGASQRPAPAAGPVALADATEGAIVQAVVASEPFHTK